VLVLILHAPPNHWRLLQVLVSADSTAQLPQCLHIFYCEGEEKENGTIKTAYLEPEF
jgi:hypothetical protein